MFPTPFCKTKAAILTSAQIRHDRQATWKKRVSRRVPSLLKALGISGRISSQLAAFRAVHVLTAMIISVSVGVFLP